MSTKGEENTVIDVVDVSNTTVSKDDHKYEKTIVFCLMGDQNISCNFIKIWTEIVGYCIMNNIKPVLSTVNTDNFVHRMGALIPSAETGQPFEGTLDYDKIVFISSKTFCTIEVLKKLISTNKDVLSALCTNKMSLENTNYIEDLDLNDETKKSFDYALLEDAKKKSKEAKDAGESTLLKVNFVNFSLLSVNKGVLEKLGLPWFNYDPKTNDISGDVYFSHKCKELGVDIFVDLDCFVSSEKNVIY